MNAARKRQVLARVCAVRQELSRSLEAPRVAVDGAEEQHHRRAGRNIEIADLYWYACDAEIAFHTLIAEWSSEPVGFALFFHYYSTWRGAGLYLEDLFVRAEFRRRGIGTSLLAGVARAAEAENRAFVRWAVLDWNACAVGMYRALGADFLDEWRTVLLAGEGLKKLVARDG